MDVLQTSARSHGYAESVFRSVCGSYTSRKNDADLLPTTP
jgi:hypothetical protein